MKTRLSFAVFAAALCFALSAVNQTARADDAAASSDDADQEIVVTANRYETPLSKVASLMTVIDSEEIERRQEQQVSDALRSVPGLDVVRSGGPGGNTSVFIRGANPEHTLVLIDGVEANNPSSTARSYNLADLSLDNVERVEVLRGPQSTLYGSDAMGGVINIITKKGKGPVTGSVSSEAGSYNTFTERANLAGSSNALNYSLGASREDTHGVSAADASDGNSEHDGYHNTSASARVGANVTDWMDTNVITRFLDSDSDIDNGAGFGQDDPNHKLRNQELFLRGEALTYFWDDRVHQTYAVSYAHHELNDDNDPDPVNTLDRLRSRYRGDLLKFEHQSNVDVTSYLRLTAGLETEDEEASSNFNSDSAFGPFVDNFGPHSARSNGYYGQARVTGDDSFFSTFGIRLDDPEDFGTKTTWRVAPGYIIQSTGTKFTATVGTAYKAPSLFERFSSFGRPGLNPEESTGWDAGVEQQFMDGKLLAGVTYFWNDFDNLISFDPDTLLFENIAKARTNGIEASLTYSLTKELKSSVTYTYTEAEDRVLKTSLLRRARNKVSAELWYQPCDDWSFDINGVLVGKRFDNDFATFPATRTELGSYVVVNLTGNYHVTRALELFARVDNLFDREYEEVLGYGTLGLAAYGGIKLNFSA